jgi:hypothetical protein
VLERIECPNLPVVRQQGCYIWFKPVNVLQASSNSRAIPAIQIPKTDGQSAQSQSGPRQQCRLQHGRASAHTLLPSIHQAELLGQHTIVHSHRKRRKFWPQLLLLEQLQCAQQRHHPNSAFCMPGTLYYGGCITRFNVRTSQLSVPKARVTRIPFALILICLRSNVAHSLLCSPSLKSSQCQRCRGSEHLLCQYMTNRVYRR